MEYKRKTELIIKVVEYLRVNNVATVPQAIDQNYSYKDDNSLYREYLYIQSELILIGIAFKTINDIDGFSDLNLTDYGTQVTSVDVIKLYSSKKWNKRFDSIKNPIIICTFLLSLTTLLISTEFRDFINFIYKFISELQVT